MNISVRFWFHNKQDGWKFETLTHLGSDSITFIQRRYIPYVGNEHPYTCYVGSCSVTIQSMEEFNKIIPYGMNCCALTEILINDKWHQIRL